MAVSFKRAQMTSYVGGVSICNTMLLNSKFRTNQNILNSSGQGYIACPLKNSKLPSLIPSKTSILSPMSLQTKPYPKGTCEMRCEKQSGAIYKREEGKDRERKEMGWSTDHRLGTSRTEPDIPLEAIG